MERLNDHFNTALRNGFMGCRVGKPCFDLALTSPWFSRTSAKR